ncbi:MAG TPA: response regulator [Thermoanaerobaculia bacterium]|nr:response regulator [Thermoanaerobaculia bacterium]
MLPFFKRKARILVLDDDVAIQKLVAMLLRRQGHRVDVVGRGAGAIEALQKRTYDAILLDLMMPHEGGMTVLRHLRDKSPGSLQKVILLTATPTPVLKNIAGEVFAVIRKPFEADDLLATVARVIQ